MSEYDPETVLGDEEETDPYVDGGRRRKKGRSLPGCLAVLVALALLVGGAVFGVMKAGDFLKSQFSSAADYPGPGKGKVIFEVKEGDTAAAIGRDLKDKGVVESVQAFTDAAAAEPASRGIQVGFYKLKKEMKAQDALAILIDPGNLIRTTVTIPEGLRLADIVELLGKKTDFKAADYQKVLDKPGQLGLPAYAQGNPEGYLFPATYDLGPKDTPESILKTMVDRWKVAAEDADLEGAAARLGYTPAELMTIASLLEAEARGKDMPKVARVIYNRLETDGYPTFGKLEIDATVNYALDRKLGVAITQEETQVDSPYNTYVNAGLPPGPIEAPGLEAMKAAGNPAEGDWYFYVTVDLRTGETKFTASYDEFLQFKAELKQYCETSEAC